MNTVFAFLFALALLVVVHELGHFWVARLCGVKVLRFSVGFGKPLLIKRLGADQTEWVVSLIPLGGYVKMLDERETEVAIPAEELPRAFNRQPVTKRIAIVVAGPLANFLLALVLYAAINWIGFNAPEPRMDAPIEQSQAAQLIEADTLTGALLQSINGRSVRSWDDVQARLTEAAADQLDASIVLLSSQQQSIQVILHTEAVVLDENQPDAATQLGLRPAQGAPMIGTVLADSPAQASGLQAGDRIVRVNGAAIHSASQLLQQIRNSAGQVLNLDVLRGQKTVAYRVTPQAQNDAEGHVIGKIGASIAPQYRFIQIRYGMLESIALAGQQLKNLAWFNLRMLWKVLSGNLSLKSLSGPLTIADYAGRTAQMGWIPYVNFLALISLSLGVLNLLPVPLLDGGHLLYYLAEIILGRELSPRAQEIGQRIGLGLLLLLMSVALFNDVARLI